MQSLTQQQNIWGCMLNLHKMINITPYSKRYKDQIIDLILSIQTNEFGIQITSELQPDLHQIEDYYQTGMGNFWVAIDADKVIGTISLLDIGRHQVALRKMFVHRDYRGSKFGVATMLLAELMNWSKDQGVKEIFLGTTAKFIAAHRFYEKNEFIEIEKSDLPNQFPVMEVDTKFYT